jgi:hypothetical protein
MTMFERPTITSLLAAMIASTACVSDPSTQTTSHDGLHGASETSTGPTHGGSESASDDAADADTDDERPEPPSDLGHDGEGRCSTPDGGFACVDGVCCAGTTGLEWQQHKSPVLPSWSAAVSYCEQLELDGGGWRLPSITELLSLDAPPDAPCDHSTCLVCDSGDPATSCLRRDPCMTAGCNQCDATVFNGAPIHCYWPEAFGSCAQPESTPSHPVVDPLTWSSSNYVGAIDSNNNGRRDDGAWYLHFSAGSFVHGGDRSWPGLARCVRNPAWTDCSY